jgi:hypothetical protein
LIEDVIRILYPESVYAILYQIKESLV